MIIVLGRPSIAEVPIGPRAGRPRRATVAMAVAAAGGRVELVGSVGDDAAGDAVAIGLARAGVGHAALLRIPRLPRLAPGRRTPRRASTPRTSSSACAT